LYMKIDEIIKEIREFVKERNWDQFHSGQNMAKSIVIEASELLELFQWTEETEKIEDLKDEIADVVIYILRLVDKYDIDLEEAIKNKLQKNREKYPTDKAYGNAKKYNEF